MTHDFKAALAELKKQTEMMEDDFDWSGFVVMFDGKHLNAIRAALELAANPWQPIDTAPKDGTHIYSGNGIIYWRNDAAGGGWHSITGIAYPGRCIEWNPTHWMPILPPPSNEPEGDA